MDSVQERKMLDPVFREIPLDPTVYGDNFYRSRFAERDLAVRTTRRLFREFLDDLLGEDNDLPVVVRNKVASIAYERALNVPDLSLEDSSLFDMLVQSDRLMKAARQAVADSGDPRLRHSAPLAKVARLHGDIIRAAHRAKRAHERATAIKALGG